MGDGWKCSDGLSKLLLLILPIGILYVGAFEPQSSEMLGRVFGIGYLSMIIGLVRTFYSLKYPYTKEYDFCLGFVVLFVLLYSFYCFLLMLAIACAPMLGILFIAIGLFWVICDGLNAGTKVVVRSVSKEVGGMISSGLQEVGVSKNTADSVGYAAAGVAVGVAAGAAIRGAINTVHNVAYDATHYADQYYAGDQNYGYADQQYYGADQNYGYADQQYYAGDQNYGYADQQYYGADQNYGYADQQYYGGDQNYGYADQQYYAGDQNYGYADTSSTSLPSFSTDASMMSSFMDVTPFSSVPAIYNNPTSSLLGLTSFDIAQQNFSYFDSNGMPVFTVDTNGNVFDNFSHRIGQFRNDSTFGSRAKEFVDSTGIPLFTTVDGASGTHIIVNNQIVGTVRGGTLYSYDGRRIAETINGTLYTSTGKPMGHYGVV